MPHFQKSTSGFYLFCVPKHLEFNDVDLTDQLIKQNGIAESWYEFEHETLGFTFKFIPKTSNANKIDALRKTR